MKLHISILFLALFLSANYLSAQEGNIWMFGTNAGINFNTSPPTGFVGNISSDESSSSVAGANGRLLLSSDGQNLYDSNGLVISSGFLGNSSSTQGVLLVRQPGSDRIYYLFTADADENKYMNGYRYSVIDAKTNTVTQKNTLLYAPCSEKLTAVRHADNASVWILTVDVNNQRVVAYKLSCSGFDTVPIISPIPIFTIDTTTSNIGIRVGYLKASPNGKILAMGHYVRSRLNDNLRLYRFDNATGKVSDPVLVPADYQIYGLEFSANSRFLYATSPVNSRTVLETDLIQYDLSSYNPSKIFTSQYKIRLTQARWALLLGPDRKIYMSAAQKGYLSCINSPELPGADCDFSDLGLRIQGMCRLGLPNMLASQTLGQYSEISATMPDSCRSTVQFSASAPIPGNLTWQWYFGDGDSSALPTPSHTYKVTDNKREYTARLVISSDQSTCEGKLGAVNYANLHFYYPQLKAGPDTITIVDVPVPIQASGGDKYLWTPATGLDDPTSATPVATLQKTQTYIVSSTNNIGCVAYDTLTVHVINDAFAYVPSAFTPNNDGLNDRFGARYIGVKTLLFFRVFNRMGSLLYETTDINGKWDGKFAAMPQNPGTYIWHASFVSYASRTITQTGTVVLIR